MFKKIILISAITLANFQINAMARPTAVAATLAVPLVFALVHKNKNGDLAFKQRFNVKEKAPRIYDDRDELEQSYFLITGVSKTSSDIMNASQLADVLKTYIEKRKKY